MRIKFIQKPLFGNNRSFSNIATSRKFKINKQNFKVNNMCFKGSIKLKKHIQYSFFLGKGLLNFSKKKK
jgi:hypothetical protein